MTITNYQQADLANVGNALAYRIDTSGATRLEYFCVPSQPNLLTTQKGWKIMRMETNKTDKEMVAGKCIMFAGGSPSFDYYATDLTTVQTYTYS